MSSDASTLPLRDAPVGGLRARLQRGRWRGRTAEVLREGTRQWAGTVSVLVIVALTLLVVVIVADRPSGLSPTTHNNFFPGWMAGPLGGIWPSLTRNSSTLKDLFTYLVTAMYLAYIVALVRARTLRARWVIGAVLAVHAIVFLAPPMALTDIFNYINYGRMEVVHHLNPYTTTPVFEPNNDPSYTLSNWHELLSPYGPLFTLLTFAVVPLGVAGSFWALKGVLALASLATLALVWRCARLLGRDPVAAIALVGLNPIVLIWGLGGDHNDFLMVLFIVLGLYLLLAAAAAGERAAPTVATAGSSQGLGGRLRSAFAGSARPIGAGAAFVTAVAIKASGGILIPLVIAGLAKSPRRLAHTLIGMVAAGAAVAVASFAAFGPHLPDLSTQGRLVTSLSIPNLLGLVLGAGGETSALRVVLMAALLAVIGLCCLMAWRERSAIGASGWANMALLVTLSWVLPWYVIWVLPLAALSRSRRLRTATLVMGAYLILVWVPAANAIWNDIGFHPERTSLGRLHQRYVKELLN